MAAASSISPVGDSTIVNFFGSYDELRRLIKYDPETGYLYYRDRCEEDFEGQKSPSKAARHFNKVFAGRRAFKFLNSSGYHSGSLMNKTFVAHRIAWAIIYGQEPEMLDHINGVRTDNRLCNLRRADSKTNGQNQGIRSDNKTGMSGIWRKKPKAWGAAWVVVKSENNRITSKKSFHCLGLAIRYRNKDLRDRGFISGHGIRKSGEQSKLEASA